MGTLQLPQYEPQQIESDRSQRQLDVSGQVALGRAQEGLLNTALSGLDLIGGIAGKIRAQKETDEFNQARLQYKQKITAKMTELETHPLKTPQEGYEGNGQGLLDEVNPIDTDLPNHRAFKEFRTQLMNELGGSFKYGKARERFSLWADESFIAEENSVLTWDIAKTKEILLDNFHEQFIQAVEAGDPSLSRDLADAVLEVGTIGQKEHDDYLDEGFQKIAGRNAIMYARSLGFEDGQKYLANRDNLQWKTHKGEQRTMSLEQQETLLKRLDEERRIAEAEETKVVHANLAEKNTDYVTREATLTESEILSDAYLRGKGRRPDVAQFVEKWVDTVRRRNQALATGGDPNKSDPTALNAAYEILGDGFLSDTEKLDKIKLIKGLTPTDYATKFLDLDLAKYRDPEVRNMLRDIDSYYKPRIAKVNEKDPAWTELNDERNKSKDDMVRALETVPPNATTEQKREAVRQIKTRIVEKYIFHAFTDADLGFDDRGSLNKFEQDLVDAVEGKKFANVHFRYSEDLIKLGEGIKTQLNKVFAKTPDNVWEGPIQGGAMTLADGRTAWMYDGMLYTLRADKETKDEILQRYNPRSKQFEDQAWTPDQWARIGPPEIPKVEPIGPYDYGALQRGNYSQGREVVGSDIRDLFRGVGRNIAPAEPVTGTPKEIQAEFDRETAKGRGANPQRIQQLREALAKQGAQ